MYKIGVVKGSLSFPNPNLFKFMSAAYTVDIPPELDKGEVFQKLKDFDGFLSAHDFLGSMAWLTFVFRDEEDLERKAGMLGRSQVPRGPFVGFPSHPVQIPLHNLMLD